jgi:hypothetical protein
VSTVKIPGKDARFHWAYCLNCKNPMYGVERPYEAAGSHKWTCGHCNAVNVFRDSMQPVELIQHPNQSDLPSTHTENNEAKTDCLEVLS